MQFRLLKSSREPALSGSFARPEAPPAENQSYPGGHGHRSSIRASGSTAAGPDGRHARRRAPVPRLGRPSQRCPRAATYQPSSGAPTGGGRVSSVGVSRVNPLQQAEDDAQRSCGVLSEGGHRPLARLGCRLRRLSFCRLLYDLASLPRLHVVCPARWLPRAAGLLSLPAAMAPADGRPPDNLSLHISSPHDPAQWVLGLTFGPAIAAPAGTGCASRPSSTPTPPLLARAFFDKSFASPSAANGHVRWRGRRPLDRCGHAVAAKGWPPEV